jgi:hypothetical protein
MRRPLPFNDNLTPRPPRRSGEGEERLTSTVGRRNCVAQNVSRRGRLDSGMACVALSVVVVAPAPSQGATRSGAVRSNDCPSPFTSLREVGRERRRNGSRRLCRWRGRPPCRPVPLPSSFRATHLPFRCVAVAVQRQPHPPAPSPFRRGGGTANVNGGAKELCCAERVQAGAPGLPDDLLCPIRRRCVPCALAGGDAKREVPPRPT